MKTLLFWMSKVFAAIPSVLCRRRWTVWILFVLVLVLFGSGASRFQLDLSDEAFFSDEDPVRTAYNKFRTQFGGDESIFIVYAPKDGNVFSEASLKAVQGIQEDLLNYRLDLHPGESSPLDHIVDVTTIVNASYLEASSNSLISRKFIGDDIPTASEKLNALKQAALSHPDYPLLYVSKDATLGGIMVRTDFKATPVVEQTEYSGAVAADITDMALEEFDLTELDSETSGFGIETPDLKFEAVDANEYTKVMHAVEAIIHRDEYQQVLKYHPVGVPVMNEYLMDTLFAQANVVMMLSLLFVIGSLWFLFRSAAAVVWPVTIIVSSAILMVATLGWLEIRMNMMINIAIMLVLVVGVADAVHILSGYIYFRNQGNDHRVAICEAFRQAGMAVFLTSVTTAIGMLALIMVPIEAIQYLGMTAAAGVLFAFLITVIMLPLMLDIWSPYSRKRALKTQHKEQHHLIQNVLRKVEHLSHVNPRLNIAIFAAVAIVFSFGLTGIKVDSNPMSLFDPDSKIVKDFTIADSYMGGTQSVEVMIDAGEEDALKDPDLLFAMESLQQFLEERFAGEVMRTYSLVDVVKDANKNLNGGQQALYRIPNNERTLEQLLFLFNSANPEDRRRVVSDDYAQAHVSASFTNVGSLRYVSILEEIEPEMDRLFTPLQQKYPNMDVSITGSMTLFAKLLDTLSWSQIKGFGLALLLISAIMLMVFGSKKIGLISLCPNLFPLIVMFGLMGYMGISLDADTLIVAPLMIGIIVDDTIHFLNHYRSEVHRHGDVLRGIKKAFREVGQAITFTSIILALAFITFIGLDHQGMKSFGILASITIIAALLAELFLLPALLAHFNADLGASKDKPAQMSASEQQTV